MKFFLILAGALSFLSVPFGCLAAAMSSMLFDAPGSENNQILWFVFASFLAYPLAALLGPILSWISYGTGHRRASIAFMAMPLIVISAVLVGFILLAARCGGRFAC
jgi:hypothetical protein